MEFHYSHTGSYSKLSNSVDLASPQVGFRDVGELIV